MLPIDRDSFIQNLQPDIYKDLIDELDRNSAWEIIVKYMANAAPETYTREWVGKLDKLPNSKESPAALVLIALQRNAFTVEHLCTLLRTLNLLDALYILDGYEELVIERLYPNSLKIEIGGILSITCEATGLPRPRYQWRHGNTDIPDQTSSTLTLPIISPDQEGEYQCIVSQYNRDEELIESKPSECVPVNIKPTCVEITKQPASVRVMIGETLKLTCIATGHPNVQYQWYKDNKKLDKQKSSELKAKNMDSFNTSYWNHALVCPIFVVKLILNELTNSTMTKLAPWSSDNLQIRSFRRKDKGRYYCIASNGFDNKHSEASEVMDDYPRQKARIKVALLIANAQYNNPEYDPLPKAINDAATVATLLKKMDFYVICLQNLTRQEMENAIAVFSDLLEHGAYGFFYFVGHGFELHGRYMMPVDVPSTFLRRHTIAEDELFHLVSPDNSSLHDPALFVVLLDMCLKLPSEESNQDLYKEVPEVWKYHFNSDPLRFYSTSTYNPSFEPINGKNGLYVSHLVKHITSNIPVEEVFREVALSVRDSEKSETSNQKPMMTTLPKTPYRYLTDAVAYEEQSPEFVAYLNDVTTFKSKTIDITFLDGKISGQIIIEPLMSPYLNAIRLTTSGLEDWDVKFSSPNTKKVVLDHQGTECHIYKPQRLFTDCKPRPLKIQLRENGTKRASNVFQITEHVPYQLFSALG